MITVQCSIVSIAFFQFPLYELVKLDKNKILTYSLSLFLAIIERSVESGHTGVTPAILQNNVVRLHPKSSPLVGEEQVVLVLHIRLF